MLKSDCEKNEKNCLNCEFCSNRFCVNLNRFKEICSSDKFHSNSETQQFPRSAGEMNLPKSTTLDYESEDKRPKLRIIKVEKKKNAGDIDLNKFKKKKLTNWKERKDNFKKMVNLDLLKKDKKPTVYDQTRTVPREIHDVQDDTDDELFLKIESGSVTTIDTEASTKSKFENKLKNTKDKYMKYQTKAINKIKSFIPKSRSNENLKFMTASDISKSRTLVADNRTKTSINFKSKPPRPPPPKNYETINKNLLNLPIGSKPPLRPVRRKSKRSLSSLASTKSTVLPASVYYRELREKWIEKNASISRSNLSSACSSSIPNCFDRKLSISTATNQSLLGDDFRYRYRADFQSALQYASASAEKHSIKSEPTYTIDGLPPKAPLRKRLTVSSYLSGSSLSLHRRLNSDYFNSNTDKSQQAIDALFWKPFQFKTNRVRSLTELYVRKKQSSSNSQEDHLQRNLDELNQIYCMPPRPPLPVRYKKRLKQQKNQMQLSDSPIYHHDQLDNRNYLSTSNQFTNLHEVYTVRDALVGPDVTSYGEKEIQTSLEDFHDLDYEDEFESSPRFIDSSTNDEFESLAKTRNLSDNENPEKKIKKRLEKSFIEENLRKEEEELKREIEEIELNREIERNELERKIEQQIESQLLNEEKIKDEQEDKEEMNEEINEEMNEKINEEMDSKINKEEIIEQIEKRTVQPLGLLEDRTVNEDETNEETTLNEDYLTVQETTSSKTIGPYLDAHQGNTLNDDDNQSHYVTLDYDERDQFDTDTLADLDSLNEASYLTPQNSSLNNTIISRPKRTKRRSQLRNSGLDTEDDDDDITDEIIGIAANLQKELKQLADKQN